MKGDRFSKLVRRVSMLASAGMLFVSAGCITPVQPEVNSTSAPLNPEVIATAGEAYPMRLQVALTNNTANVIRLRVSKMTLPSDEDSNLEDEEEKYPNRVDVSTPPEVARYVSPRKFTIPGDSLNFVFKAPPEAAGDNYLIRVLLKTKTGWRRVGLAAVAVGPPRSAKASHMTDRHGIIVVKTPIGIGPRRR